ncbi:unnamed protein product [Blepharisma stoltei]|uniref:Uncharacterized protein n=1 Tax=Blepharisma stoltei TaxID=1481888 RepID=A0AAU9KEY0_9CILI|nr:unnamed protein product [Blepharisma stoltei]
MIGSNLMLLRGSQSPLSKKYILKLIILKSFIFPALWLLVIFGFWEAGIFGDNRVMAYTIFIGQSSPITVVVLMVAQMLNAAIAECSVMFLWQYLAAPVSLTFFTYIFFLMT